MVKIPKHQFFSQFRFVPGAMKDAKMLMKDKISVFYSKGQEI